MTSDTVSRGEFDARLIATETKSNAHFDRLTGTIESVDNKLAGAIEKLGGKVSHLDTRVSQLEDSQLALRTELKADLKGMRLWMIGTAVSVVTAIAGINHSMISNLATFYGAGRDVGIASVELKHSIDDLRARLPAAKGLPAATIDNNTLSEALKLSDASR